MNINEITTRIGATIAIAATCASALALGSDDWMRQQLLNWNTEPVTQNSIDKSLELAQKADEAIEKGDWSEALDYQKQRVALAENDGLEADVNRADYQVVLAMLYWNADYVSSARSALEKAIRYMERGENLGGGCEKNAKAFLQKMRNGELPSMFTSNDFTSSCGIRTYVMAPVQLKFNINVSNSIARSEAIIRAAESMTRTYQMQGERQAMQAKYYARESYRESTGRDLSPDYDTRPSYGKARDEWDSCKRVYDIFGK